MKKKKMAKINDYKLLYIGIMMVLLFGSLYITNNGSANAIYDASSQSKINMAMSAWDNDCTVVEDCKESTDYIFCGGDNQQSSISSFCLNNKNSDFVCDEYNYFCRNGVIDSVECGVVKNNIGSCDSGLCVVSDYPDAGTLVTSKNIALVKAFMCSVDDTNDYIYSCENNQVFLTVNNDKQFVSYCDNTCIKFDTFIAPQVTSTVALKKMFCSDTNSTFNCNKFESTDDGITCYTDFDKIFEYIKFYLKYYIISLIILLLSIIVFIYLFYIKKRK